MKAVFNFFLTDIVICKSLGNIQSTSHLKNKLYWKLRVGTYYLLHVCVS